jgi:hypothetical protein
MLAMGVNDNACVLVKRVALEFIASTLAPTEDWGRETGKKKPLIPKEQRLLKNCAKA